MYVRQCAIGGFIFRCQYIAITFIFQDFIIFIVLYVFTKYHTSIVFICHGEIGYFRHGQGRDGMMQDSPAAHKNYTIAFCIQKEIAIYKLNNYILVSLALGTVSIDIPVP